MFQDSYQLYEVMEQDTYEKVFARTMTLSNEAKEIYRARLLSYTSWKHAGMIIRPGNESYIQHMVSFDPLYLIDQDHDYLKPALKQFPKIYQTRLRPYIVNEYDGSEQYLARVPDGQFGICFAFNFFNFKPLEVFRRYLEELYQKLKPGGVLILTFNDCDWGKAVELVERHYCPYTPGRLIRELATTIGYEIVFDHNDRGPSTWMELKKPGELTSLRGGQTLAKIIPGRLAKSK